MFAHAHPSPFGSTLRGRLQRRPELDERGLWQAQAAAVRNLEKSLADNRPRALIQMATGSGKTHAAVTSTYRLVKFAAVAFGSTDPDLLSSLASRLARLDKQLDDAERASLEATANCVPLKDIVSGLVDALDPDRQAEAARIAAGLPPEAEPTPEEVKAAARDLLKKAAAPLAGNPKLRDQLALVKQRLEQTIDTRCAAVSRTEAWSPVHSLSVLSRSLWQSDSDERQRRPTNRVEGVELLPIRRR